MTLLDELMLKRAALDDNLVRIFKPHERISDGKPITRDTVLRGNAGRDHITRKHVAGEKEIEVESKPEHISRTEHSAKGKSEASIKRMLGLFGADE